MSGPVHGRGSMQQVFCALAVALQDRDALFAEIFEGRVFWVWEGARGILSGTLPDGARWAAQLADPAPPFCGRALVLEIADGEATTTLVRALAPHDILPA